MGSRSSFLNYRWTAKATIIPLGKVYESFYSAPPHEKSRAEPYYEEHHEIQEITDYGVPDLNTSVMVRTSVCDLLPVPATDVKVWTRGLEPTNGGTVFPSEVHPQPAALRGVSLRGYRHRHRSRRTVGLCAHPRSLHQRLQPAALRGSSLRASAVIAICA